jgi:hypothetical protein
MTHQTHQQPDFQQYFRQRPVMLRQLLFQSLMRLREMHHIAMFIKVKDTVACMYV